MKRCTNCGRECLDTALFCKYCGTRLKMQNNEVKFCSSCGEKLDGGAFCSACGAKAEDEGFDLDALFDKGADSSFDSLDFLLDKQVREEREKKELSAFEYTLRQDGSYTVLGCKDKYAAEIKIPTGVVAIGDEAFVGSSVISVSLPEGLKVIGKRAFSGCKNLKEINYPPSLSLIGDEAFFDCRELNAKPSNSIKLGIDAFCNTKFYINDNFIIYDGEFQGYKGSDKRVRIPDGVRTVHENSIRRWSVGNDLEIIVPGSVKTIKGYTFYDCENVSRVEMKEGVENIETCTFSEAKSIKSVSIPGSVRKIDGFSFNKCRSLEKVELGDGIETIDTFAFCECTSLKSLVLPGSLSTYDSAFNSCSSLESVRIEPGVKTISNSAFANCLALRHVSIPKGVVAIGSCAFDDCKSLREIILPEGVTEIRQAAFHNCSSLDSIELPSTVRFIGQYAFSGCGFKYFTIPESVEVIESLVFYGCKNLREVRVPRRLERYESTILNGLGNDFRVVYY